MPIVMEQILRVEKGLIYIDKGWLGEHLEVGAELKKRRHMLQP